MYILLGWVLKVGFYSMVLVLNYYIVIIRGGNKLNNIILK